MRTTNADERRAPLGSGAASGAEHDAEVLARRALGLALNAVWSDDPREDRSGRRALAPSDAATTQRAIDVLRERVPAGPELSIAVDLLERAAIPTR